MNKETKFCIDQIFSGHEREMKSKNGGVNRMKSKQKITKLFNKPGH